jgi:hypothetical protein
MTVFLIGVLVILGSDVFAANGDMREKAADAYQKGNYNDAFQLYEKLCLTPDEDSSQTGNDMNMAMNCLASLNRAEEVDAFREKVIAVHPNNWRLLSAAAQSYANFQHFGFLVAGQFQRGGHRGGGQYVNAYERDRVRAIQLMTQACQVSEDETNKAELANFYLSFADMLSQHRGQADAWRLQYLTDLTVLPDYEEDRYFSDDQKGAAVDAEGSPIFHGVPESWEAAQSDGERWRWLLKTAVELDTGMRVPALQRFAGFLHGQFGVQTLAGFFRPEPVEDQTADTGVYALHTLSEDETIARLATGVKRFRMPDEFNFIRIFGEISEFRTLGQIFENRRQYVRAAEFWGKAGETDRVKQITGNWGIFEPFMTQPAGRGAAVDYRFRNGKRVRFEAHAIHVQKVLEDVKDYIRSNPRDWNWQKEDLGAIGYRIVQENETRYLGEKAAEWALDLEPPAHHFDRRITVTTPLQKPGAYLLKAYIEGGNVSRIIIWLDDTVIIRKPMDKSIFYYAADAVTGQPVKGAKVEFFGYRREWRNKWQGYDTQISNFAEYTDENGQVILSQKNDRSNALTPDMRWLVISAGPDGRLAYLGFNGVWYATRYDEQYHQNKVFTITDRPVYRPGHTVKFKCWMGQVRYDQPERSDFAGGSFSVQINNPKGEKVFESQMTADEWGGVSGEWPLPEDATLGMYHLYIPGYNGGNFRVEEYKKPEFEVTVESPDEPVMLGETVKARILAQYYFGGAVTHAKVKYKVLRYPHEARWYPPGPWDWFYGRGYGWLAYDYAWYPGWSDWGCVRPLPWWGPRPSHPPEVVMENETEIGPDGGVNLEIDTRPAQELHGDMDHRYEITVEVTDQSRRTIVGKGSVMAARKPFTVYAGVDKGYYRAGETVRASFNVRTPDDKPVQAKGQIRLLKISYDENGKPTETLAETWDMDLDAQGEAVLQLTAADPGQYRLSGTVTDEKGRTGEGAYIFMVRGQSFDGNDFRFNALELIPEKETCAPGETAKLMINTDRLNATVLLFLYPANGVYLPPKVIRMDGKSLIHEISVLQEDMPNFFAEALTISDGRVHTELREILVPPAKRILNLEVLPESGRYKPGEKASVTVKLTDAMGEPFVGSTVLTVYDKAVEYIYGGSNVPDIRAHFWKWRRHHTPFTESSLNRQFDNLLKNGEIPMQYLGVFGDIDADELMDLNGAKYKGRGVRSAGMMAAPAPMMAKSEARETQAMEPIREDSVAQGGDIPEPELQEPVVRTQFADTAFWGSVITDKNGVAVLVFDMPENLTGWKIRAWSMGKGTRVGQAEAAMVTAKDLMVRLQAPRFFVQKDEVMLSANIHNYLETRAEVQAVLELDGPCLTLMNPARQSLRIEAGGEVRADWRVSVVQEGQAVVRMKAISHLESDAMEMRFPVYVHGIDKMVPFCGLIRPEMDHAAFTLEVPNERRPESSRLEIRYSPTLAGAMVDALPYLAGYPYGCTEQTLNRFLPTVMTRNALKNMGLNLTDIQKKRTNLNAQEIGKDEQRGQEWKRYDRSPVFDENELNLMIKTGVQRLTHMQLSDGGWGWFSGWGEHSYPHTTAVVIHGLQLAEKNGVAVVPNVIQDGVAWLKNYQSEQVKLIQNGRKDPKTRPWKSHADDMDALVYMILADAGIEDGLMREFLYEDRSQMSVYAKSMYGMALHRQNHKEKLDMILQNIGQYLVQDNENQTAWLNLGNQGYWWYWYGSEIEAHAYYLKLLSLTDPQGETASRMVKYLLNNRKHSTYWNSTRDTAVCIEAFADYLAATGEARSDMTVEIRLDGEMMKLVRIQPENLFSFDNKFVIEGDAVKAGRHTIELHRKGKGPLYFNAYLSYFTLEDYITKAGLEIKVDRRYYKLNKADKTAMVSGTRGQALEQKVEKYDRQPLEDLALLKSGDLVEVELEIESKNDYEYIVFEDMKAAGFEPVEVRSGYSANGLGAYMELRDEKVALFVRALARGSHSIAYRMRAEIPGKFSALPTQAYGMYAPELRANSDEIKLRIED